MLLRKRVPVIKHLDGTVVYIDAEVTQLLPCALGKSEDASIWGVPAESFLIRSVAGGITKVSTAAAACGGDSAQTVCSVISWR